MTLPSVKEQKRLVADYLATTSYGDPADEYRDYQPGVLPIVDGQAEDDD